MFANASPLEVAYTIPSFIGFLISAILLYLIVGDEMRRRQAGVNGIVRLDLQKSLSTAAALTWSLGALTMIGVNQMYAPPNPLAAGDATVGSTVVINALLFVSVDIALICLALYRLLQRSAVQRELDREVAQSLRRDRRVGDVGYVVDVVDVLASAVADRLEDHDAPDPPPPPEAPS